MDPPRASESSLPPATLLAAPPEPPSRYRGAPPSESDPAFTRPVASPGTPDSLEHLRREHDATRNAIVALQRDVRAQGSFADALALLGEQWDRRSSVEREHAAGVLEAIREAAKDERLERRGERREDEARAAALAERVGRLEAARAADTVKWSVIVAAAGALAALVSGLLTHAAAAR